MPKLILAIIYEVLKIFSERGKSAPARLEKREDDKFKKALKDNDLITMSYLLSRKRKRVLASRGNNTS